MPTNDEWGIWSKHVLITLERLGADMQETREKSLPTLKDELFGRISETRSSLEADIRVLQIECAAIRADIVGLKVRAGLWGGIAGAIPAAVAITIALLKGLVK